MADITLFPGSKVTLSVGAHDQLKRPIATEEPVHFTVENPSVVTAEQVGTDSVVLVSGNYGQTTLTITSGSLAHTKIIAVVPAQPQDLDVNVAEVEAV